MITSLRGVPASCLGLAAHPEQDPRCVRRAFDGGINYFFFYGPGNGPFIKGLVPLIRKRREEVIVATGSGGRQRSSLLTARRKILAALGAEMIDVFFAEYVNASDDPEAVFGEGGLLDELQQWKADGWIRYVGATTHDRSLARRLAEDAAGRCADAPLQHGPSQGRNEVFPTALQSQTPIVAFTATRWGTLLEHHQQWPGDTPSRRGLLSILPGAPAVHIVLTAPRSLAELEENLECSS